MWTLKGSDVRCHRHAPSTPISILTLPDTLYDPTLGHKRPRAPTTLTCAHWDKMQHTESHRPPETLDHTSNWLKDLRKIP